MTIEAASVRLAGDIKLATVLGNSEDGLSVQEIADKTGVDGVKLGSFATKYVKLVANDRRRTCYQTLDVPRLVP
jgi:hypothetical protein